MVLVVVLVTAGCGRSDEVNSSPLPIAGTTAAPTYRGAAGTTQRAESGGYDVTGRDVEAICAQLLVIAKDWDGGGYSGPQPSTPEEQAVLAKQFVDEMSVASDELNRIAPPDLASDMASQVAVAKFLLAQKFPGGSALPDVSALREEYPVGKGQPGLEAFARERCGFSIWDYERQPH
jgi:hypothetical protein